jgi:hypothetical protein
MVRSTLYQDKKKMDFNLLVKADKNLILYTTEL